MVLEAFSAPANLDEMTPAALEAWSERLKTLFDDVTKLFPKFYNPTVADTPSTARTHRITWPAFPGRLQTTPPEERWELADGSRDQQDEYCEWSVLRDGSGAIEKVTFTTEVPDYFDHLMDTEQDLLLRLYGEMTGQPVTLDDLRDVNGIFAADNGFNSDTSGSIVHLMQQSNNLRAAVTLGAEASILRERNGQAIADPQSLVLCGNLGDASRHSDPQIASAVNNLVASGFDITLTDPPGLYLDRLVTAGMVTPDGRDAQEFWHIERGDSTHAVRARFEVPADLGYKVGDILLEGRPLTFGGQLAERLHIRIEAVSKASTSPVPERQPCVSPG